MPTGISEALQNISIEDRQGGANSQDIDTTPPGEGEWVDPFVTHNLCYDYADMVTCIFLTYYQELKLGYTQPWFLVSAFSLLVSIDVPNIIPPGA